MTALPHRHTPRVLVVDDEQRLRDMLVRTAQELGFEAAAVRSAEPAAKLLEQGQADILVLDLNLPGMGGMELLEKVRQSTSARPGAGPGAATHPIQVIILTGFGTLETAKKAIRLDAVDFLTKPCPLEELERALAKARRRWLDARHPLDAGAAPSDPDEPCAEVTAGRPMTLDELERLHILAALDRNVGNRAATAAELGISERTLYYRISAYQRAGISPQGNAEGI